MKPMFNFNLYVMSKEEIWNTFAHLAQSQGMYGRLMESIENSGRKDEILTHLEEQNFSDPLDLILFIEQ